MTNFAETAQALAEIEQDYCRWAEELDEHPAAEQQAVLQALLSIAASSSHLACALLDRHEDALARGIALREKEFEEEELRS